MLAQQTSQSAQQPEKLLVNARHGKFVVLAEDLVVSLSLMYYGEYHEHEWQFVKRFLGPSQVIVDAGANLGTFTVPFAKAVAPYGQVHSFEPQPVIRECLRETLALNNIENVTLHPVCLGNGNYELEIDEPDYNQPGNFSGVPFQEKNFSEVTFARSKIHTSCTRLDDVLKGSRLDFLKIDVEGMETELLRGAAESIKRHQPVIYTENNRLDSSPELIRTLHEMGYRLWWHTGPFFNPHNFAGRKDDVYGNRANINMICIPDGVDEKLISPGLRRVENAHEHIMGNNRVLLSNADDVDGR